MLFSVSALQLRGGEVDSCPGSATSYVAKLVLVCCLGRERFNSIPSPLRRRPP